MSEAQSNKYFNWQEAAAGGNLASYALGNVPGREDLVPGAKPEDNRLLKGLDYVSLPARLLTNALLAPVQIGGEALARWQAGDQSPATLRLATEAVAGMALNGLGVSNPLRMRPNELLAIPGYHGTPHTFAPEPGAPLGSFRSEKIGSGEGAQSYGWGHYVAEREGVARSYQENLAGQLSRDFSHKSQVIPDFLDQLLRDISVDYPNAKITDIVDRTKEYLQSDIRIRKRAGTVTIGNDSKFDPALLSQPSLQRIENAENTIAWLDRYSKDLIASEPNRGNLYHVEIAPDKHQLLDWDQPFSKHSPEVQKLLRERFAPLIGFDDFHPDVTGKDIYLAATKALGSPRKASELLHEAGIPGLQFLDQQSRRLPEIEQWTTVGTRGNTVYNAAYKGKSIATLNEEAVKRWLAEQGAQPRTHNFVIFHPQNLRITGANGKSLDYIPVTHDPFTGTQIP